jgi:hypothetical protein
MPLRDHFHPPVSKRSAWESFHAMWPAMLVVRLSARLPEGYVAEPRARLGQYFEVDVGGHVEDVAERSQGESGGVATLPYAPPKPTVTLDADIGEQHEYEVLIYDQNRARELVAAIEFVSPGNKDRPEFRSAFVTKCAALLGNRVCVAIVDLVTTRRFNLYAELLEHIGQKDPTLPADPSPLYAVTCRTRKQNNKPKLDNWVYPMEIGRPLPELPLWLAEDVVVPVELEASYEETCRILKIA